MWPQGSTFPEVNLFIQQNKFPPLHGHEADFLPWVYFYGNRRKEKHRKLEARGRFCSLGEKKMREQGLGVSSNVELEKTNSCLWSVKNVDHRCVKTGLTERESACSLVMQNLANNKRDCYLNLCHRSYYCQTFLQW